MMLQSIQKKVQEIATLADLGDPEAAHAREDRLYREFIEYVEVYARARSYDPVMLVKCQTVLSTKKLKFPRWYA